MSYCVDLRERDVNAVVEKHCTLRQAAETFEVSKSSVARWLRRYRREGDMKPRVSPGRPSSWSEHQAWVVEHLRNHDLTHEARRDALFEHSGVRVSPATMSRWVKRLGNTRKDAIRQ